LSEIKFSEVIEYMPKKSRQEQPANLVARVIGDGLNHYGYFKIDLNNLSPIEVNKQFYNVKQEAFFLVDRFIIRKLLRKIRSKIKKPLETYHSIYREGEADPLIVDKPVKGTASSRLLKTIRQSTALQAGVNELFRGGIDGRRLMFFLLVGGVVIFALLILTGQIDLTGMEMI